MCILTWEICQVFLVGPWSQQTNFLSWWIMHIYSELHVLLQHGYCCIYTTCGCNEQQQRQSSYTTVGSPPWTKCRPLQEYVYAYQYRASRLDRRPRCNDQKNRFLKTPKSSPLHPLEAVLLHKGTSCCNNINSELFTIQYFSTKNSRRKEAMLTLKIHSFQQTFH